MLCLLSYLTVSYYSFSCFKWSPIVVALCRTLDIPIGICFGLVDYYSMACELKLGLSVTMTFLKLHRALPIIPSTPETNLGMISRLITRHYLNI